MSPVKIISFILVSTYATASFALFEAHEWGTFTSLVGSNGLTQHGMYHEDEVLPDFVHAFGETQQDVNPLPPFECQIPNSKMCFSMQTLQNNIISQKMETPVIYFYSDQFRTVDVNVRFPEGVITETFPAPESSFPKLTEFVDMKNGSADFRVNVYSPITDSQMIPAVDPGNIYGHARATQSNVINSGNDYEKFIFYRGLGRFQPEFSITSTHGNVVIATQPENKPSAAFLVSINENGEGNFFKVIGSGASLQSVADKTDTQFTVSAQNVNDLQNNALPLFDQAMQNQLVSALVDSGLFQDEALAMYNTWKNGYFKTPGLRLLYILPRSEVDTVLPLTMKPQPETLERVFVGRIEIMLDTEEKALVQAVATEGESFDIHSLGRIAEPKLRRGKEVYMETCKGSPAPVGPCSSQIVNVFDHLISTSVTGGLPPSVH